MGSQDFLYVLGDFAMGGKENIVRGIENINCKNIILILGNHDIHIAKNSIVKEDGTRAQDLFYSVHHVLEKKIGNDKFFLSHYSHRTWHKAGRGSIHLYGHSHGSLEHQPWGKSMDVCIEIHPEFRPFHIDEIRAIMAKREVYAPDHHALPKD